MASSIMINHDDLDVVSAKSDHTNGISAGSQDTVGGEGGTLTENILLQGLYAS